jgi:antitoxin FitA
MRHTCLHAENMSKMIQIRNVPDSLHRKIKARAAHSGMTLSDYLRSEIEQIAALPTRDEMLARLHTRTRIKLRTPAAEIIRQERESV